MRVAGIILCGGESRRMGRPKAWLRMPRGAGEHETLLERVVRVVGQVVAPVCVVGAPGQELPSLRDEALIVRDAVAGRGPLQGLAAGLRCVQGLADAAYVSSCDVPFLQPAFIERVIALLGDAAIAVPHAGGRYHPLAAVYRTAALREIDALLAADRLRPFFLFERVATRYVREEELREADPDLRSLCNINHPEEYEAALRELAGAG